MKNFFNKIKSYSFWVSLSGAIIVLLNAFGNAFGFEIENQVVEDCVMSVASVLVVLGVVANGKNKQQTQKNDKLKNELSEDEHVEENETAEEEVDKKLNANSEESEIGKNE